MKKYFLLSTIVLLAFFVQAQNYETVKNALILNQYRPAKENLDKGMANSKFASKPEAYILKTCVYAGLAMDKTVSETPEADQLRSDAETAFAKYLEMEPSLTLMKDPVYRNGPINLYSSFYSAGYKDYQKKDWQHSHEKFKKVVDLSDLLIKEKIFNVAVDTNGLILAGVTAESSGNTDDAAKYYSRLADLKISGEGYESVYRFLVNYYFKKNNIPSFEKYKASGKELYPKSEYFNYDKIDFAVGLEDDFNKKVHGLEEMIAADPNNFKAHESLGEIIYDTLNPRKDDAVPPANAGDLEKKMIAAFTKAAELNPQSELPQLHLADHYINKSIRINDAREAHTADMKKRTKPGTAASKEDIQKRDALDEEYGNALDAARVPYEKAVEIYTKRVGSLTGPEKQQYKKAIGYLSDIYKYKKERATKAKATADAAKFAAEQKKWDDLYDSIK
jgi:tetratricopeptide (TPR) repeat protein